MEEEEDESDFGEFSSASPKHDRGTISANWNGLNIANPSQTTGSNEVSPLSTSERFQCANSSSDVSEKQLDASSLPVVLFNDKWTKNTSDCTTVSKFNGSCGCELPQSCHSCSPGTNGKCQNFIRDGGSYLCTERSPVHERSEVTDLEDDTLDQRNLVWQRIGSDGHKDYIDCPKWVTGDSSPVSDNLDHSNGVIQEKENSNTAAGNQFNNWAAFEDATDVCVTGNGSWLAFQDDGTETETSQKTSISSDTADTDAVQNNCVNVPNDSGCYAMTSHAVTSREEVLKCLEFVYPSSGESPVENAESHDSNSKTFTSNLLELIGEHSTHVTSRTSDSKHSTEVHQNPSASVWDSLKVMEDTAALKFNWSGSHSSKYLMKSLAIESPTRLSGRRVQKLLVPKISQEAPDRHGTAVAKASCRQQGSAVLQKVQSLSHLRK